MRKRCNEVPADGLPGAMISGGTGKASLDTSTIACVVDLTQDQPKAIVPCPFIIFQQDTIISSGSSLRLNYEAH